MAITDSTLEHKKYELGIGMDDFDEPAVYKNKHAWTRLITQLLFLRKGTYPSDPLCGIGIQTYDFQFMDTAIDKLNADATEQARIYLPDVPLERIQVTKTDVQGMPVLLVYIILRQDASLETSVIAAPMSSIIDFEISM